MGRRGESRVRRAGSQEMMIYDFGFGTWVFFTTVATVEHNRKFHIETPNSGQVIFTLECPLGFGTWVFFTTVAKVEHNRKFHIETPNSGQVIFTLECPLGFGTWVLGLGSWIFGFGTL